MLKKLHPPEFLALSALGGDSEEGVTSKSISRWIWHVALGSLLCVGFTSFAKADPISVTYAATQVSGDEWQYDYQILGSYSLGDDLAVYFPLATSLNLDDLGTGGSDWGTFVFQPDPSLPADGEFDMVANLDNPSLTQIFSVQFQYLASGTPGLQSFTLYDPNFDVIYSGSSQSASPSIPTVPEPTPFLLVGAGLAGMWQGIRHRFFSLAHLKK